MDKVLNYPGAKWSLAEKIIPYIPDHHSYLEPFFGSGAVFFSKEPSRIETINDLDSNVVNLFDCIRREPERLAATVMATPYSREMYDRTFNALMDDSQDSCQRAADFLVSCWQTHGFRVNKYRVGWKNDVQGRVQIENRPALEVIGRFNSENVFMYLDPPYVLNTRNGKQYAFEMTDADHAKLLETICSTRAKVMISGYENVLYEEFLAGWKKVTFPSKTAYGAKRVEAIWMNY